MINELINTYNISNNLDKHVDDHQHLNKMTIFIYFIGSTILITSFLNACKGCIKCICLSSSEPSESDIENYLIEHTTEIVPTNEECSICLQEYNSNDNLVILQCNHKYHHDCIKKWFYKEMTCPNCRIQID